MPEVTIIEITIEQKDWMLKELRRYWYGLLLGLFTWCRTRWSCAALALTISARTNVSWWRKAARQQLRAKGFVWKRAKLKAQNDDLLRANRFQTIQISGRLLLVVSH